MKPIIRTVLIALAMAATTACTSFDRAWAIWRPKNMPPQGGPLQLGPRTQKQSPADGRWVGRWTSERHRFPNGQPESGRLRLVLAKHDAWRWRANVRANWLIFRADYETFLDGKQRGNSVDFHGQQDVAAVFGGPYRYDGTATAETFTMRYDSRYDSGTFEMRRPPPGTR